MREIINKILMDESQDQTQIDRFNMWVDRLIIKARNIQHAADNLVQTICPLQDSFDGL